MIQAVLLAAGMSTRYGDNKLVQPLGDGRSVFEAALENLHRALPNPIVVVSPTNPTLYAPIVQRLGATLVVCPQARRGMGHSLACGVHASSEAEGWLIALADMPFVTPDTSAKIADAIKAGASIAVPVYRRQRGHPVGFARRWRDQLMGCHGERGAVWIMKSHPELVTELPCSDPGVCHDIDTPTDVAPPPSDQA